MIKYGCVFDKYIENNPINFIDPTGLIEEI